MHQPVVCSIYRSQNVGKSVIEELSIILKDHAKIIGQQVSELELNPMDADYFVVPSNCVAETVHRLRPQSKTLLCHLTLNVHELPKLLTLPTGTNCLIVAASQETAEDTLRLLREFGFTRLNLVPYWPGKNVSTLEPETAITPGSPHLCPRYVSKVVDLGPSRIDIITKLRLCLDLNLPWITIDNILFNYVDEITVLGRAYIQLYQKSDRDRAFLIALFDSMRDAIAAFDVNGTVMHSTNYFKRLMEATSLDLNKFLEDCVVTASVERVKGKHLVVEKFPVKTHKTNPVGTLLIMRPTEKVSDAELVLRRSFPSSRHVALYRFSNIIGVSPQIKKAVETAKKIASGNLNVLITGETGTGKELFAHAIHNFSLRVGEPFVCTHFAALPPTLIESELFGYDEGAFTGAKRGGHPGCFEQAHKGSIFFDEIGDAPPSFQSHLLRVLEAKRVMRVGGSYPIPIDVRVIAATNQDLKALVRKGHFREDLFYRLNVIPLALPPLRSRAEDIPILAKHFLSMIDGVEIRRLSSRVLGYLKNHPWPGNIRQLENVVKYMAQACESEILDVNDLPPDFSIENSMLPAAMTSSGEMIKDWETSRELILLVLETLATFHRSEKSVGKGALIVRAKEQGHNVSDYRIRKLLLQLNYHGLVHIGSTSQGTVITNKGLALLNSC